MNKTYVTFVLLLSGCASGRPLQERAGIAASAGLGIGALGGALFSPNDESRLLNTMVFGLAGAVIGGGSALILDRGGEPKHVPSLKERELGIIGVGDPVPREFQVGTEGPLPEYLKGRIKPAVIEEVMERDSITEDGGLREPHKVYRIKRPAELVLRPEVPEK